MASLGFRVQGYDSKVASKTWLNVSVAGTAPEGMLMALNDRVLVVRDTPHFSLSSLSHFMAIFRLLL